MRMCISTEAMFCQKAFLHPLAGWQILEFLKDLGLFEILQLPALLEEEGSRRSLSGAARRDEAWTGIASCRGQEEGRVVASREL